MPSAHLIQSFDGTKLYVETVGKGPAVVLCDGIGCDGFILRYLRPMLQDRYRVVKWHYRGHGNSAAPKDRTLLGIPELRRDLQAVLDGLRIDEACVLGYSMGVQLALDFTLHHPQRVTALIPMCGSYGHMLETFHDNRLLSLFFPHLRSAVFRWPRTAQRIWSTAVTSEALYQLAINVEVQGRLVKRADFKPYFDHLGRMDARLFFAMLDRVRVHTVEPRLGEISVPTLIIAGEKDTFTPVWLSKRMAARIPGAELLVVPWGTHCAPLEMPELVGLRILRFLEDKVEKKSRTHTNPKKEGARPTGVKIQRRRSVKR